MIFKKSRDKPAGYAVLVSGEQEWKHAQKHNWTWQIVRVLKLEMNKYKIDRYSR